MNDLSFKLTASQKVLKKKMKAFLDGPERFFLLTGKPGVGKTTMTKIMLADLIQADIDANLNSKSINMNVAGISLAHQAKNVLGEYIPSVYTFAKAYGMKEDIDEHTGKRSFTIDQYDDDPHVGDYAIPVFVHDEVSQYTQDMLDIVFDRTPMFSKIIFMGDRAQLPPIDPENKMGADADSPIFDYDVPDECKHELTERVRQAEGNSILDLTDVIREEIFGNQDVNKILKIISTPNMTDNVGYDIVKYRHLEEHLEKKDFTNTCVIAYRNKTVKYFNGHIRNHVLQNPNKMIIEGDIVCMTDNYYKMDPQGFPLYVLHNSDKFRLGQVYTKIFVFQAGGRNYKIDCYVANIIGKTGQFIVPTESGEADYQKYLTIIAEKCKRRELKWPVFWEFKGFFCRFIYGYSVTAYKTQGSTYDDVYLDINDVLLTWKLTPKRRLQSIYTAITRARYRVYFLKNK